MNKSIIGGLVALCLFTFNVSKSYSQTPMQQGCQSLDKAKKQIEELKNFVENWSGNGGNLILVTHYIIITAVTDAVPRSGEIVIVDKKFNVLSTIQSLK